MSSPPPPPPSPYPQDRPAGAGSWEQPPATASYGDAADRIAFAPTAEVVQHPQATLAFVLGLLSVLGLLIFGPFGWFYGRKVMREIDRDPRPCSNRGLAVAGMWLGVVGTIFLVFVVGAVVLGIGLVVLAASRPA